MEVQGEATKSRWGVAITARKDISNKVTKVENIEEQDQEVVWVELKKNQIIAYS